MRRGITIFCLLTLIACFLTGPQAEARHNHKWHHKHKIKIQDCRQNNLGHFGNGSCKEPQKFSYRRVGPYGSYYPTQIKYWR